jgi:peptide/nickel transport system substrate-binding protein
MKYISSAFAVMLAALTLTTPVDAKVLRINVTGDPAMMDPITYSEIIAGRVIRNVYEGFTDYTPDGKIINVLAESWAALPGEHGFRFNLRKNVKFHSGRPFTSKDVKYTMEQLAAPDTKAGLGAGYVANIVGVAEVKAGTTKELSGIKIIDDHTIEVRFTKPDVLFPIYPIWFMDSGIVAEKGADWVRSVSAGTGPYKFKEWRRGVHVEIEANKAYWAGAPKIDGIRFLVIPSGDTALSQYEAGELDFLDVQENTLRRVMRDASKQKGRHVVPRAQSRYLGMNANVYAPFKDKRVREAISMAINRDAMIRGFYDNAAFQLHGITTPGVAGYFNDLPKPKYDPEAAKKLLAEAGFPGGKGLPPIDISSTAVFKDELTYYANELNRTLGMQVNVNVVERATFIRAMNAGEVAFFPWGWTSGYPDAMYYLEQMWHSKSPYNRGRWFNAKYDALIDEATATVDDAKRFQLYRQAEMVYIEDFGAAPLPMVASIALVKPNVTGARATPFGFDRFVFAEIK